MHSDVFSVIADPTRRRIVRILAEQTHTVGAVVEKLGMSQPTISKHLKVLRDADVVSVTVEGQRRLYSLNPDVFATVTEWINETVQIARQSSEAHVPVALPGGATAPAENKSADKASEKVVTEKVATAKPSADVSSTEASGSLSVEAPSAEEIEQARIQRARAQYLTPSARIYSRPAEQASESAASEASAEKTTAEPTVQEEAVDSTPMRPFTPASYGYDAGVTPAASATPAQPTTPAAPAEAKPVVAQKPVVFPQPAAAVSYGVDPAAVVGGSIQPIAVTPEAPAAEEPAVAEKTVNEQLAEKAEEKPPVEETVVAEKPAVEESATEKAAVEESDKAEGASEASSEEPEYQTMPAYDSVYRPSAETTNTEAKDNHRGGLFGFLRGRRR